MNSPATSTAVHASPEACLLGLRAKLGVSEDRLIALIGERQQCRTAIGRLKRRLGEPLIQPQYVGQTLQRAMDGATRHGLDAKVVRALFVQMLREDLRLDELPSQAGAGAVYGVVK